MDLMIQETKSTPGVYFYEDKDDWLIFGRSYPSDARAFYTPVFEWLDSFKVSLTRNCTVHFKLEFCNTATTPAIVDILLMLKKIEKRDNMKMVIKWHYEQEDEDMMDFGTSIMEIAGVTFEMVSHQEI